jgi:hypothetical protein
MVEINSELKGKLVNSSEGQENNPRLHIFKGMSLSFGKKKINGLLSISLVKKSNLNLIGTI